MGGGIVIRPANRAACADLEAVFGRRGEAARCLCQRARLPYRRWHDMPVAERRARLTAQTACGRPEAAATSGLLAFLGDEPAGWCAVGPRTDFLRYHQSQSATVWAGRSEDRADATVWAAACFVTRAGYRRRGVATALACAAATFARERGARAIEGYPLIPEPGRDVAWGELSVGAPGMFAAAGLVEVSRPSARRVVMRLDFRPGVPGGSGPEHSPFG